MLFQQGTCTLKNALFWLLIFETWECQLVKKSSVFWSCKRNEKLGKIGILKQKLFRTEVRKYLLTDQYSLLAYIFRKQTKLQNTNEEILLERCTWSLRPHFHTCSSLLLVRTTQIF